MWYSSRINFMGKIACPISFIYQMTYFDHITRLVTTWYNGMMILAYFPHNPTLLGIIDPLRARRLFVKLVLSLNTATTGSSHSNISQFCLSRIFYPFSTIPTSLSSQNQSFATCSFNSLLWIFLIAPGNHKCTGAVVRKRMVLWPQGLNVRLLHIP